MNVLITSLEILLGYKTSSKYIKENFKHRHESKVRFPFDDGFQTIHSVLFEYNAIESNMSK